MHPEWLSCRRAAPHRQQPRGTARSAKARIGGTSDHFHVLCPIAFRPRREVELDVLARRERLEAFFMDARVVYEDVLAAVITGDEAIALVGVEHLDGSGCHRSRSLCGALLVTREQPYRPSAAGALTDALAVENGTRSRAGRMNVRICRPLPFGLDGQRAAMAAWSAASRSGT